MLDVGIKETTTTTGTGTVTLSSVANHARVEQAFGVGGAVGYCLTSGNGDREWGIGVVGAGNTLARSVISATLVGTTYTKNGSAISLSGTSELVVTPNGAVGVAGAMYLKTPSLSSAVFCPYAASNYSLSTMALPANRVFYLPFQMQAVMFPITTMGTQVTTAKAGSTLELAIYESKFVGNMLVPGTRVAQVSLDSTTTGTKFSAINFTPRPGSVYWFAVSSSANVEVRAFSHPSQVNLLGIGIGHVNSTFWIESTGSTTPADASGESFAWVSSGSIPHLVIGY